MRSELKLMLCGHFVLDCFQFRRVELDDLSALRADHVVVMFMLVIMFVVRATVAEAGLARKPSLGQQLERPVHGCLADARIFRADQPIEVITRDMTLSTQKDL